MKINSQTPDGVKIPVFSQGICFPVSILPGEVKDPILSKELLVGTDVTEFLGIKKYDEYGDAAMEDVEQNDKHKSLKQFMFKHRITRPIAVALFSKKKNASDFPSFVSKTDETRIQSLPHL